MAHSAASTPRSRRASIRSIPDITGIRMSVTTRRTGSPESRAERIFPRASRPFPASLTRYPACRNATTAPNRKPSSSSTIRTCGAGGATRLLPLRLVALLRPGAPHQALVQRLPGDAEQGGGDALVVARTGERLGDQL